MKILLAEDQAMIRTALSSLLALEGGFTVVDVEDGQQARDKLVKESFDLLLSDIEMPGLTGIELAQFIHQQQLPTKVIIFTTFGRSGYVKRAMDANVSGFLLKDAPVQKLIEAIHDVMAGKKVVDTQLLLDSLGTHDPLTDKERIALRLAADGKSTADIAKALFVAEGTARNYL